MFFFLLKALQEFMNLCLIRAVAAAADSTFMDEAFEGLGVRIFRFGRLVLFFLKRKGMTLLKDFPPLYQLHTLR